LRALASGISFAVPVSDPSRLPSSDDGLEELGDEVIIAQETEAHSPQPRVQVATDQPSIMISEPQGGHRKRMPTLRTRNEKTVIIRDRKQLEQMRRAVHKQKKAKPAIEPRTLYWLGAAALASLALGTLIAFIVDSRNAALPAALPHTAETVTAPRTGTAPIEEVTPSSPKPRRSDAP
jgi:hypothetical protein